ncbi:MULTISPECIES: 16S rRNA pseudouridine(516) synthase RsuA [Nitrincola]|uniref:Pseudouridine synthase n=1 Tax=Nitrincola nitratireducens TaxID=1229521 RepID=W9VF38_9GAMM|nr:MULTISPECIES: 16S rRNA pseudouridine(516) synthase RsuA [Nitrincola]EXJ09290.1 Ribosomal small subunit pseudouridine synthase A [Nitrincola nitratireducens]
MRLDKYLAQATGQSRKDVKRLIHAWLVSVNGEPERDSGRHILETDEVEVEGTLLSQPRPLYIMLHKPADYVCATDDPTHPTVLTLIDSPRANALHIAGRLDIDATGLVLLTDDGKWSHQVTSPKHKTDKLYHVSLADPLDAKAEVHFEKGLLLKGEKQRTKPAHLERIDATHCWVTLTEGRYHQVKRMFAALGNRVTALHRQRIGRIELDETLLPGEYRELTPEEVRDVNLERTETDNAAR